MLGTKRRVMSQLKTTMPSSENVAHVCSHDHLRTRVMGRIKVPCSKPANSTSRKPRSKGIGVIVVASNCLRTKLWCHSALLIEVTDFVTAGQRRDHTFSCNRETAGGHGKLHGSFETRA